MIISRGFIYGTMVSKGYGKFGFGMYIKILSVTISEFINQIINCEDSI
jgi:hypothetical protein